VTYFARRHDEFVSYRSPSHAIDRDRESEIRGRSGRGTAPDRAEESLSGPVNLLDCGGSRWVPSSVGPTRNAALRERPMGDTAEGTSSSRLYGGPKLPLVPACRARAHTALRDARDDLALRSEIRADREAAAARKREESRNQRCVSRVNWSAERCARGELICEILRFINICSTCAVNIRDDVPACVRACVRACGGYRNERPRIEEYAAILLSAALPLVSSRSFGVTSRAFAKKRKRATPDLVRSPAVIFFRRFPVSKNSSPRTKRAVRSLARARTRARVRARAKGSVVR